MIKMTMEVPSGYQRDIELAKEIPGLDVVVGGHTPSFLYSATPNPSNNEVEVGEMAPKSEGKSGSGSVPDDCE